MRRIIIAVSVIIAAAAITAAVLLRTQKPVAQWKNTTVRQGDLVCSVTATGTLNARTTVLVGTQVSGTVARVCVDYNDRVKRGQVLAILDTTMLHAACVDARAGLAKAAALADQTKRNLSRSRSLFEKQMLTESELDQAVSDVAVAEANLETAKAQVEKARISLNYATIVSPIDGVVISRSIDVGQTVAASFSTPTLFTIAEDLVRMEVSASIDEADVASVKAGQRVTFTVDAYADSSFAGTIRQVRLAPVTTQNVVTYTAIADVENPQHLLMPGMTATLTIVTAEQKNALIVPASALRFKPDFSAMRKPLRHDKGEMPRDTAAKKMRVDSPNANVVFVNEGNFLRPVHLSVLLDNGSEVAVTGKLEAGQEVVTGAATKKSDKTSSATKSSAFGMMGGPPGGMPPPRGM